jgi:hypothetical protein
VVPDVNAVRHLRPGALGIYAKFASRFLGGAMDRAKKYYLQSVARYLIPTERVARCHRSVTGCPEVWYSEQYKKARFAKLVTCGSVWICAVCASKITEKRRVEISELIKRTDLSFFMVTFTLQHSRADGLKLSLARLSEAYRRLKSGRWWKEFERKYGILGSISGQEVTYGHESGFHPHKHVLFVCEGSVELNKQELKDEISTQFRRFVAVEGGFSSEDHGVVISGEYDAVKTYVSKWGLDREVTKGINKASSGGFTPFELLAKAGEGEDWAKLAWLEFAHVIKGSRQLVWSRGLRSVLGQSAEKTDKELAGDEVLAAERLLATLSYRQWDIVLANGSRSQLLDVADSGDPMKLLEFLQHIGAGEYD